MSDPTDDTITTDFPRPDPDLAKLPATETTTTAIDLPAADSAITGGRLITRIVVKNDDPDGFIENAIQTFSERPVSLPDAPFGNVQLPTIETPMARLPAVALEHVPAASCVACSLSRDVEDAGTACPRCGSGFVEAIPAPE